MRACSFARQGISCVPGVARASMHRPATSYRRSVEAAVFSNYRSRACACLPCAGTPTRWREACPHTTHLPAACRYNDELARKRGEGEHEKQRARNRELVALQEEGARRQEAERRRVAEQIEAERRATEKYKVLRHARRGLLPQTYPTLTRCIGNGSWESEAGLCA